jgi:hypothetical protein
MTGVAIVRLNAVEDDEAPRGSPRGTAVHSIPFHHEAHCSRTDAVNAFGLPWLDAQIHGQLSLALIDQYGECGLRANPAQNL